MKVRELLENGIAGEKVKRYSAVNIGYTDRNGLEQETQLNVAHRLDTEEGKTELEELFASLCEEFETTPDNVTYVTLGSADRTWLLMHARPKKWGWHPSRMPARSI